MFNQISFQAFDAFVYHEFEFELEEMFTAMEC